MAEAAAAHRAGQLGRAAGLFEEAARSADPPVEATMMLGVIAQQAGNALLALGLFDTVLAADPHHVESLYNRAVSLHALGRADDALASLERAVTLAPDLAEAWDLQGQVSKGQGAYAAAEAAHRRALDLAPDRADFYASYAATMQAAGDLPAAIRIGRQGERLNPAQPPLALGHALRGLGYPLLAADIFERLRATKSAKAGQAELAACEAMARLQAGDDRHGLPLWERRPDLTADPALAALPLWDGQPTDHLILYEDQGLGDAIQFLRFVPLVLARCRQVTLGLAPSLIALCRAALPAVTIVALADIDPAQATARSRLMSLMAVLGLGFDDLSGVPYLAALPHPSLPDAPSPRIGVVWAGNPAYRSDRARSLDLACLQPLLTAAGPHLISLQAHQRPGDAETLSAAGVADAAPLLADWQATASVIAALDLVVTVDTAVAHLAGALGKPVFLVLSFDPDWRWLLGRADSPWYAATRLYRQHSPGDWSAPVAALTADVGRLIAGDRTVLTPPRFDGEGLRQNPFAPMLPV